ncbi:hypothetical protein THIX_110002 [Thiomonas sp. X19]|nr:hypothetical protein THIX_110002 [Thiomonas sp. X19]
MTQMTFTDAETALHGRVTQRQKLLADMQRIVPWARLVEAVYPKSGRRGRPPIGAERMLRFHPTVVRAQR